MTRDEAEQRVAELDGEAARMAAMGLPALSRLLYQQGTRVWLEYTRSIIEDIRRLCG